MSSHQAITVTQDAEVSASEVRGGLALRWVFPEPGRRPVWLKRELVIGRDEGCELRIDSAQVSRRHAGIEHLGGSWLLRDLGSKNGIRVNGNRVAHQPLAAGDVVRVGDAVLVVVAAAPDTDLSFRYFAPNMCGGHLHANALAQVRAQSRSGLSVVIEGETGTGKERFAAMLHAESGRTGPFLPVNCAVYSQSNAAAELFGYRRGAFTGAGEPSMGHVRAADGGTLFLDEVAELPLDVQPMLLRAVENREVIPLGEARARPVDVRFVAAAQRPLEEAVSSGRFRADLRARLEQAVIRLPRLADCRELLAEALASRMAWHGVAAELSAGFVEQLCLHSFPLNWRELENLARRLAQSPHNAALAAEDLARELNWVSRAQRPAAEPERGRTSSVPGRDAAPYTDQELVQLRAALERCSGNVAQVAAELGISRPRVYRMLKHLEGAGPAGR